MNIDFRSITIVVVVCLLFGLIVDYFTRFNWLTSGLGLLAIVLINGLIIDLEDRQPGGWDYVEDESAESKKEHRKAVIIHFGLIAIVIVALITSLITR